MSSQSRTIPWSRLDGSLRERWSQLAARQKLNPTLKPGWMELVTRTLRASGGEPQVYLEEGADGLTAAVPYYVTRVWMCGVPMRVIQPASNLISYHAELITSAGHCEILRRLLDSVRGWDVLHFSNLVVDGETARAVTSLAAELQTPLQILPGDESPWLPVEGTWEAFLAGTKKKFRYKLRHRRELLDAHGSWNVRWYEDAAGTDELLAAILKIEAASWKARDGVDIPSRPHELEYHRQLLPFLAKQGALFANVLYIGEQPAAYCLCCRDGGWIGNLKTSFDERFGALSPGAVAIDMSIERAFALGAREFDFLGDAGPHKLSWSPSLRLHADYLLFAPRLKAKLVGRLKTRHAGAANTSVPAQPAVPAEAEQGAQRG